MQKDTLENSQKYPASTNKKSARNANRPATDCHHNGEPLTGWYLVTWVRDGQPTLSGTLYTATLIG